MQHKKKRLLITATMTLPSTPLSGVPTLRLTISAPTTVRRLLLPCTSVIEAAKCNFYAEVKRRKEKKQGCFKPCITSAGIFLGKECRFLPSLARCLISWSSTGEAEVGKQVFQDLLAHGVNCHLRLGHYDA